MLAGLATTLREQVLVPWAVYNFGSADVAPWPAWDLSPPTDRKQDAEVLDTRTRAAVSMAGQGAPVDWRKFAEENGVPLLAAPTALAALSATTPVSPAELTALVKDTDDTALQELILGAVMCSAGAGAFTAAEP